MSENRTGTTAPTQPAQVAEATDGAQPAPSILPTVWKSLGIAAAGVALLVVYGVYAHLQAQFAALKSQNGELAKELRGELGRLSQNFAGLVKKDEHSTRIRTIWDTIKELRTDRSDLTVLKERCSVLSDLYKTSEMERKVLAEEVHKLRQKTRAEDDKKDLAREIQTIRERISQIEGKPSPPPAGNAEESEKP